MQESQDKLEKLLFEKFADFEVQMPKATRDTIFANIKASLQVAGIKNKLLYLGAILICLSVYLLNNNYTLEKRSDVFNLSAGDKTEKADDINRRAENKITISKDAKRSDFAWRSSRPNHTAQESSKLTIEKERVIEKEDAGSPNLEQQSALVNVIQTDNQLTSDENAISIVASADSTSLTGSVDRLRGKKFRITVSAMPFLNYTNIIPLGNDGVRLTRFQSPPSLSLQRVGFRSAFSLDYDFGKNRVLFGGLTYFSYRTQFNYSADEATLVVNRSNSVNEHIYGVGVLLGTRLPLKVTTERSQFLSAGIDTQISNTFNTTIAKTQLMLNVGYANNFRVAGSSILRVQPTLSYSLTKFQFPGMSAHPYWVGVDIAYSWLVK